MATPYFQVRLDSVASTQDVARERFVDLPVVVITRQQTQGRGRSGAEWLAADRALAVSLAVRVAEEDHRPFSLMAGVAAARVASPARLKWPNDLMRGSSKVGGILAERSAGVVVLGLGVNLWWESPPEGMGCIEDSDPGPDRPVEVGCLWAAEILPMLETDGWPIEEYRQRSDTIGRKIVWDGEHAGEAIDVAPDGGLVVRGADEVMTLYSGTVRHSG